MQHQWYRIPQAAADAVAEDGQPRVVEAIDQDGAQSLHVLFIDRAITPAVQSCLLTEWSGAPPLPWPPE